jgi:hypothetical protein
MSKMTKTKKKPKMCIKCGERRPGLHKIYKGECVVCFETSRQKMITCRVKNTSS